VAVSLAMPHQEEEDEVKHCPTCQVCYYKSISALQERATLLTC